MVYKRYREESEAARMVWINSLLLSEHEFSCIWLMLILQTWMDFADRGREGTETDEKDNGPSC